MDKLLFLLFSLLLLGSSCTNNSKAKKALLQAGYHPIEVGGYGLWKCGEDDTFATKFKAYSPDSTYIVKGVVCGGWLKGSTIRLD